MGGAAVTNAVDAFQATVHRQASLSLESTGHPHISYYDLGNDNLEYASWSGTAWIRQTVDATGDVGYVTSLVLDSGGHPHIAYFDSTNSRMKYATLSCP